MKIVKINGGLGNQMFQFAFYKALQHSNNNEVFIDLSAYQGKQFQDGINLLHNGFELPELFSITYQEAPLKNVKKLSTQPKNLLNRVLRKYFTKKTHFIDKNFGFNEELISKPLPSNIYLEGYWQTEKYFSHIKDELLKDFSLKTPLSKKNLDILEDAGTETASIHIRRGDYLKTQTLNVCSKDYYLNAIKLLFSKANPKSILVFSDDIPWCKSDLKLEEYLDSILEIKDVKVYYIDWNTGKDSYQDMQLMSKCKYHIIANSSFSWWGAYLDPNPEKIVIAPSVWNLRELNPSIDRYYKNSYTDILPSSWIRAEIWKVNESNYSKEKSSILFPDKRLAGGGNNLQKAQSVMLRILKVFDAICKKHNLDYWLDAGTLLGAARHGGFIPWDDDVDVIMPIDSYVKFCKIAESELPFDMFFQTKQTDSEHDITWAKIRDRFSYMDDPGGPYPYCQGIPIDIFPAYIQTKREFKLRNITGLLPPFNNSPMKTSKRFSFKHNLYNFVFGTFQRIVKVLLWIPGVKYLFIKYTKSNNPKNLKGYTYNPERPWFQFFPIDMVYPLSQIKFEDALFLSPRDVNGYLTHYYNDWQTLPPETKRDVHGTLDIHLTDAGPKPDKHSLKWTDYYPETNTKLT